LPKFLVDESVGAKVSEKLKQMGFDAVSVIESMQGAEDLTIVRKAMEEKRIIITNDKDFGWLVTLYKSPGIILLRLKEDSVENRIRIIKHILEKYGDVVFGNIIIATEKRVRVRRL